MPFTKGHSPANRKHLDEQLILDLYQNGLPGDPSGWSTNRIASRLGCHKACVVRVVKKYGLLRYRRMTPNQQRAMVRLYQKGLSAPVIAKRFKVCSPAVYLALQKYGIERRRVSDYDYEEPLRHDFFDRIDQPSKAYWLGFLLADGCVFGREVILGLSGVDRKHVALWRRTIGSRAKLSYYKKPKTFGSSQWLCPTSRLTIRSRRLTQALADLGVIPAKTLRTTYPKGIPENLTRDFWRGFVDGDGTLFWSKAGRRRQFTIGITGDLPLIEAFQKFCLQYVPTRATIQRNGDKIFKFTLVDWFAYRIAEVLYGDACAALSRKQRIFVKAKKIFAKKKRQIRNWPTRPKEISA